MSVAFVAGDPGCSTYGNFDFILMVSQLVQQAGSEASDSVLGAGVHVELRRHRHVMAGNTGSTQSAPS